MVQIDEISQNDCTGSVWSSKLNFFQRGLEKALRIVPNSPKIKTKQVWHACNSTGEA